MTSVSGGGFPSLAHVLSRMAPDGTEHRIANTLTKKKPVLGHIPWVEGNLPTGHEIVQTTTALPSGTWRGYNEGINPSLGETSTFVESCALLEDASVIDVSMAEQMGGAAWRSSEDGLKTEGLGQQAVTALWYESASSNPKRPHGLAPRYPATSGYTSSSYTIAGTNAGVNAHSIWIVTWDPRKVYGIYPKGTRAGLEKEDMGKQRISRSDGSSYYAWETRLRWRIGFAVEDYRYLVRIQWDPDDAAMASDEKGLYLLIQQGLNTIYEITEHTKIYLNRTSKGRLDSQLAANDANFLQYVAKDGRMIPSFLGVEMYLEDLLVAETAIS
jgi:hypothetical protein